MNTAVKAKAEGTQKVSRLESSISELEKRYMEACEGNELEASEDPVVLKKNIHSLVKTIPARYTRIVASIAKLKNVASFYGLVAGDSQDESGKETFEGAIGVLRYVIAHGDTCL